MANAVASRVHRSGVQRPGRPLARWSLWLGFLALLSVGVGVCAERGLHVRRDWTAAHQSAPAMDDSRFVADRLLHYTNRPGYVYESQDPGGAAVHYTNNALGLRGPEVAQLKPRGGRRVVLVGASTVYGALDDDADTISVQLEAILHNRIGSNIEVVNGGVPGYVALQEVLFYRSHLANLEPDVLIDLDGLNDVFYGSLQEWPAQIAAYELGILADGRFPEAVSVVDSTMFPNGLLEHQLTMLGRSLNRSWHLALYRRPPLESRIASERTVALHAESLGLLARYGRDAGLPVIAALQPLLATGHKRLASAEQSAVDREGYWSEGSWQQIALAMYPRMAETTSASVTTEDGTFVDLTGVFDDESGATYAEDAVHYTRLGNHLLAQALATLVEQRLRERR